MPVADPNEFARRNRERKSPVVAQVNRISPRPDNQHPQPATAVTSLILSFRTGRIPAV